MNVNLRSNVGKVVATYETESKTLRRRLYGSKHLLRFPAAIAFDEGIILQAEKLRCEQIEVEDKETGNVYFVPFAIFKVLNFPLNRGFGNQLALSLSYWKSSLPFCQATPPLRNGQRINTVWEPRDKQLSLF